MHRKDKIKRQRVDFNKLKPMTVDNFKPTQATHIVSTHRKENKPEISSNAWIAKFLKNEIKEEPSIFEIEAISGDFYRLLIGNRQPKARAIFEEDNPDIAIGIMTKLIDKFTPISERHLDLNNLTQVKQLAEITVACRFIEEGDLSDDNLGFNAHNELVKIDHGNSLWTILKDYKKGKQPVINFSLTAEDIRHMPLVNQKDNLGLQEKEIQMLSAHPEFIKAKFKSLLKIALMTDDVCHSITEAFTTQSLLKYHIDILLIEKRNALLETLKNMPEFERFINDNPKVIDEIKSEYREFNREFHKDKNAERRINITKVESQYSDFLSEMKAQTTRRTIDKNQDEEMKARPLKKILTDKIQFRLGVLSNESSTLAKIKNKLFTEIEESIKAAASEEDIRKTFYEWLQKPYKSQGTGTRDAKYNNMTVEEIMSLKRNWDPRTTTKSQDFIIEARSIFESRKLAPDKKLHDNLNRKP